MPFNEIAWHAGESSYGGRSGYNKYSIGIEIVNSGPLTKSGNVYRSWFGAAYNPSDVVEAIHRNQSTAKYWHVYTAEQIETVRQLCLELMEAYPNIKQILGHEEVAPTRKTDPGPAFPLDTLREQLLRATAQPNSRRPAAWPPRPLTSVTAPSLTDSSSPSHCPRAQW